MKHLQAESKLNKITLDLDHLKNEKVKLEEALIKEQKEKASIHS
jgi:hypothetical protein